MYADPICAFHLMHAPALSETEEEKQTFPRKPFVPPATDAAQTGTATTSKSLSVFIPSLVFFLNAFSPKLVSVCSFRHLRKNCGRQPPNLTLVGCSATREKQLSSSQSLPRSVCLGKSGLAALDSELNMHQIDEEARLIK